MRTPPMPLGTTTMLAAISSGTQPADRERQPSAAR